MRFKLERTRTISVGDLEPLCKGAILAEEVDRIIDAPGKPWDGNRVHYKKWAIEINTLEELMAFVAGEGKGKIVIYLDGFDENKPVLEIYDDYRE